MIRFWRFGVCIQVSIFYLAVITIVSFLDQTGIAIWGFLSSLIHELGHIIVLYMVGGNSKLLSFELTGIRMTIKQSLSIWKEAIILSAGCIVNFLCCILCMKFGLLNGATVNFCIGAFNLLPGKALDGGRLLTLILNAFMSLEKADRLSLGVSIFTSVILIIFGFKIFFVSYNPTMLATGIFLLLSSRQYY